ncbi:cation:proton antiporter [Streptomyces capillispiralis]|uniref:CPA2 family monovalent cation:H+ antiporter-2 n=2 Tax=Streptomyces TaxID=1883 RepID=A0AA40SD47_9ACTN|nr:cation:proton antiporter [Streptomyces calvus]MBA8944309.1 CPA2 family monovalent cation:H+ antiporter-2 [Streptomyces calvus]MBA8976671.1 CPA2 family monovalent cation:H+ antiporter-2 [Streptomyces calvus]MYS25841.1 cation:proton antiporter [Streptomyces sp. SID7804]GGP54662.1 potassium transporter [Streptomyces calvus]
MRTPIALLLELGIILTALSLIVAGARRFALTPVPLYLLAGLALGDGGIAPVPAAREFVDTGATLGLILLLLTLGLDFTAREFTASLRRHRSSAVVDLVLNAIPGAVAGWLFGLDAAGVLALAGATYVSSSGIIARLLGDLRRLGNRETPAVLSVLVLEDFAMAAYLPLLAVVTAGGSWWEALLAVLAATAVVGAAVGASSRWGHHVGRVLSPADAEQVLLRLLGFTLVIAALAEMVHVSAAVGAFLVGLTLTGAAAERARTVLGPLRDLFAAVFFLALGMSADPGHLLPALPAAAVLALITAITKVATGWYAAGREGAGRRGRLRAGTALVARGEFSVVVIGLAATAQDRLAALVTCYVILLAVCGPVLARLAPTRGVPSRMRAFDRAPGMLDKPRPSTAAPTPDPARSGVRSG